MTATYGMQFVHVFQDQFDFTGTEMTSDREGNIVWKMANGVTVREIQNKKDATASKAIVTNSAEKTCEIHGMRNSKRHGKSEYAKVTEEGDVRTAPDAYFWNGAEVTKSGFAVRNTLAKVATAVIGSWN